MVVLHSAIHLVVREQPRKVLAAVAVAAPVVLVVVAQELRAKTTQVPWAATVVTAFLRTLQEPQLLALAVAVAAQARHLVALAAPVVLAVAVMAVLLLHWAERAP